MMLVFTTSRLKTARLCFLLALAACTSPAPTLDGRDLSQVICQPGDLPAGLNLDKTTAQLPEAAEGMVSYYSVLFGEHQLTYENFFCSIALYTDSATAHSAFATTCEQMGLTAASPTTVGEESCEAGPSGVTSVLFRRGVALALIQADLNGSGVSKAASMVDGRLK